MMMLSWLVVIALAMWLVLYLRPNQSTGAPTRRQDAEELLAERFARGEIDEDEFTRRRDVLAAEKQVSP